jgi:hypothetical protein
MPVKMLQKYTNFGNEPMKKFAALQLQIICRGKNINIFIANLYLIKFYTAQIRQRSLRLDEKLVLIFCKQQKMFKFLYILQQNVSLELVRDLRPGHLWANK